MNLELEKNFINNFINTKYNDRLLFEFNSSQKRVHALMRFSHDAESLIKEKNIYLKLKKFDEKEMKLFLKEDDYYVISFKHLDGVIMDASKVLNYMSDEDFPVIVCGKEISIVKKEFEKNQDNYYLLKKQ